MDFGARVRAKRVVEALCGKKPCSGGELERAAAPLMSGMEPVEGSIAFDEQQRIKRAAGDDFKQMGSGYDDDGE
ncbi:unnamed protein product [Phytophthora fragariaefolia]|uniref:Unnamed protein product n=1 Tax=Phytophthora fragariaefolia TaxID=1490495 RepID=A0A9W6YA13_9STRA|nr:unnamed protein product [Phytophthora fragariaefolia]